MSVLGRLAAGEVVEVEAVGGSMFPLIRDGDRVVVEPIAGAYRDGDIVLVANAGRWILHRIVDVSDEGVITCGDNKAANDPPVSPAHVVGRATHVLHGPLRLPLRWPPRVVRAWSRLRPYQLALLERITR